jgi:nucleoside-diphosphate-sugar epimerase
LAAKRIYLTGATGLVGASIARMLLEQGHSVRGLVRDPASADSKAIAATGVEMVKGDISDINSVLKTMSGCDSVIHSAAALGGPTLTLTEAFAANTAGTMHVLASAARLGISPCVQVLTTTYFDMWKQSLTEHSPIDLKALNLDPYTVSKRFAFLEGDARARAGQDIRFVIPGGCYGPSPAIARALTLPSFDALLVSAFKGEVQELIDFPIPWSYVDDVAWVAIAALERGMRGERYIAHGVSEEVSGMSVFCNAALEVGGSKYRVHSIQGDQLNDPAIRARYGDSWVDLAKTPFPKPWSDSTFTQQRLGYKPTALRDGLRPTIDWMRKVNLI